jgi:hypothetical protein
MKVIYILSIPDEGNIDISVPDEGYIDIERT